jgi:hypothetical protein
MTKQIRSVNDIKDHRFAGKDIDLTPTGTDEGEDVEAHLRLPTIAGEPESPDSDLDGRGFMRR